MLISSELAQAINAQIGHELGASHQYLSIAAWFDREHLTLLAKLFLKQSDEEHEHALKFVHYLLQTGGELQIPAVPAPTWSFASAEEAVAAALRWEQDVTGQVASLMDLALAQNDHLAKGFLQWFVDEQLEEVAHMETLLSVIQRSGERNLLMVEAYLAHLDSAG